MVTKNGFYAIHGPTFKGIVQSTKEYKEKVNGKKATFGKRFKTKNEAEIWLTTFQSSTRPVKKTNQQTVKNSNKFYAIHSQTFKGIVDSNQEFKEKMRGRKGTFGKGFSSKKDAQQWLDNFQQIKSNENKQHKSASTIQEIILYIDGSFKNQLGKYGFVAFTPMETEPIFKDFGFVYDEQFNGLKNIGAEIMACLRALEWAFSNQIKCVHIIYDYEGIVNLLHGEQSHKTFRLYKKMVLAFQQKMEIHFLHVRHGNKELHQQAHNLTQLSI